MYLKEFFEPRYFRLTVHVSGQIPDEPRNTSTFSSEGDNDIKHLVF